MLAWVGPRKALRLAYTTSGAPGVPNCPEIPEGCARLVVACRMVALIEARRMGRSEVSFPSPYARRASPLTTDLRRGRLCWSANERKPNGLEDQRADVPEVHPLRRAVPAPAHHGEGVPRHQALRRTGNLQPLLPGAPAGIHSQGTHRLDRRAQVLIVRTEDAPPEVFREGLAGYAPLLRAGECSTCAKEDRKVYPTVRELAEMGHPCIEPCPLPSSKRSNIW